MDNSEARRVSELINEMLKGEKNLRNDVMCLVSNVEELSLSVSRLHQRISESESRIMQQMIVQQLQIAERLPGPDSKTTPPKSATQSNGENASGTSDDRRANHDQNTTTFDSATSTRVAGGGSQQPLLNVLQNISALISEIFSDGLSADQAKAGGDGQTPSSQGGPDRLMPPFPLVTFTCSGTMFERKRNQKIFYPLGRGQIGCCLFPSNSTQRKHAILNFFGNNGKTHITLTQDINSDVAARSTEVRGEVRSLSWTVKTNNYHAVFAQPDATKELLEIFEKAGVTVLRNKSAISDSPVVSPASPASGLPLKDSPEKVVANSWLTASANQKTTAASTAGETAKDRQAELATSVESVSSTAVVASPAATSSRQPKELGPISSPTVSSRQNAPAVRLGRLSRKPQPATIERDAVSSISAASSDGSDSDAAKAKVHQQAAMGTSSDTSGKETLQQLDDKSSQRSASGQTNAADEEGLGYVEASTRPVGHPTSPIEMVFRSEGTLYVKRSANEAYRPLGRGWITCFAEPPTLSEVQQGTLCFFQNGAEILKEQIDSKATARVIEDGTDLQSLSCTIRGTSYRVQFPQPDALTKLAQALAVCGVTIKRLPSSNAVVLAEKFLEGLNAKGSAESTISRPISTCSPLLEEPMKSVRTRPESVPQNDRELDILAAETAKAVAIARKITNKVAKASVRTTAEVGTVTGTATTVAAVDKMTAPVTKSTPADAKRPAFDTKESLDKGQQGKTLAFEKTVERVSFDCFAPSPHHPTDLSPGSTTETTAPPTKLIARTRSIAAAGPCSSPASNRRNASVRQPMKTTAGAQEKDPQNSVDTLPASEVSSAGTPASISTSTGSGVPTSASQRNATQANQHPLISKEAMPLQPATAKIQSNQPKPAVAAAAVVGENKHSISKCKATLFCFHNGKWNKLGRGDFEIYRDTTTDRIRLTMRADTEPRRVYMNHFLTKTINFRLDVDNKSVQWGVLDLADGDDKPVSQCFSLEFDSTPARTAFMLTINELRDLMPTTERPNSANVETAEVVMSRRAITANNPEPLPCTKLPLATTSSRMSNASWVSAIAGSERRESTSSDTSSCSSSSQSSSAGSQASDSGNPQVKELNEKPAKSVTSAKASAQATAFSYESSDFGRNFLAPMAREIEPPAVSSSTAEQAAGKSSTQQQQQHAEVDNTLTTAPKAENCPKERAEGAKSPKYDSVDGNILCAAPGILYVGHSVRGSWKYSATGIIKVLRWADGRALITMSEDKTRTFCYHFIDHNTHVVRTEDQVVSWAALDFVASGRPFPTTFRLWFGFAKDADDFKEVVDREVLRERQSMANTKDDSTDDDPETESDDTDDADDDYHDSQADPIGPPHNTSPSSSQSSTAISLSTSMSKVDNRMSGPRVSVNMPILEKVIFIDFKPTLYVRRPGPVKWEQLIGIESLKVSRFAASACITAEFEKPIYPTGLLACSHQIHPGMKLLLDPLLPSNNVAWSAFDFLYCDTRSTGFAYVSSTSDKRVDFKKAVNGEEFRLSMAKGSV